MIYETILSGYPGSPCGFLYWKTLKMNFADHVNGAQNPKFTFPKCHSPTQLIWKVTMFGFQNY